MVGASRRRSSWRCSSCTCCCSNHCIAAATASLFAVDFFLTMIVHLQLMLPRLRLLCCFVIFFLGVFVLQSILPSCCSNALGFDVDWLVQWYSLSVVLWSLCAMAIWWQLVFLRYRFAHEVLPNLSLPSAALNLPQRKQRKLEAQPLHDNRWYLQRMTPYRKQSYSIIKIRSSKSLIHNSFKVLVIRTRGAQL